MILQVFAIEDTKANVFNTPFFMRSLGEALRAFTDLANDRNSMVSRHPTDYRLVRLGTYNDEDASFVMHKPEPMGRADEYVEAKPVPMKLEAIPNA